VNRDRGEATVILATIGALATSAPLLVPQITGAEDGLYRTAAFITAIVAIGVGVGKVWQLARILVRKLDQLGDLVERSERMELRQLATQEQLRDLSARFDAEHPPRT